jgi:hypothetical protein
MMDGNVLCVDHTFKSARRIKIYNDVVNKYNQIFTAALTVYNEYNQVCAQYFATTKSYKPMKEKIDLLLKRYECYGHKKPNLIYSDNCCKDRADLMDSFGSSVVVKLDSYHFIDRYLTGCRQTHPLYKDFCSAIRDAIFVLYKPDRDCAIAWAIKHRKDPTKLPDQYLIDRCRRTIPEKSTLHKRLDTVYNMFLSSGLYKPSMQNIHKNALVHVDSNCLSDPDDFDLYFSTSGTGRNHFGCKRGTSNLEGYHSGLNGLFSGANVSPVLADIQLASFNYRWNVTSGVRNRNDIDYGFFDHFLVEKIKAVASTLDMDIYTDYTLAKADIKDAFGCFVDIFKGEKVLLAAVAYTSGDDVEEQVEDIEVLSPVSNKRKKSGHYMAAACHLPHMPFPVESKEERDLFTQLQDKHGKNHALIAKEFNDQALKSTEKTVSQIRLKILTHIQERHVAVKKSKKAESKMMPTAAKVEEYNAMRKELKETVINSDLNWISQPGLPFQPIQLVRSLPERFQAIQPLSPHPKGLIPSSHVTQSWDIKLKRTNRKMHCTTCGKRRIAATGHFKNKKCPLDSINNENIDPGSSGVCDSNG